jgi:hypothetical protein
MGLLPNACCGSRLKRTKRDIANSRASNILGTMSVRTRMLQSKSTFRETLRRHILYRPHALAAVGLVTDGEEVAPGVRADGRVLQRTRRRVTLRLDEAVGIARVQRETAHRHAALFGYERCK